MVSTEKKLYNGKYIWRKSATQVIADGVAGRSLQSLATKDNFGKAVKLQYRFCK
jgi:hypothetical protein